MHIDFLIRVFEENRDREAIIWNDESYSYAWLLDRIRYWHEFLKIETEIMAGLVVTLEGDYSPDTVALLLALIDTEAIIVPLSIANETLKNDFRIIASVQTGIALSSNNNPTITRYRKDSEDKLYDVLRQRNHPGLILFSSGSTGESKAAVHDLAQLLKKYHNRRHNLRTIAFLLFDHIGGIDTLFYSLSNGSCLITIQDRSPDAICRTIEKHRVEVLPVSPTFLNLLLISETYKEHDLTSLKYITYGTEIMLQTTLSRCTKLFPNVKFLQKYGTTETGTLRSKSLRSDSIWVKIGGEGFKTRIVNGMLQIKADSAMLGYLNAQCPFTDDGWFHTGDEVEVDGEYIKFKGRKSEIINVGGEKVFPAEIENLIQQMDNVAEVVVFGEKNPIVGNIVCARVRTIEPESRDVLANRVKKFCRTRLESYKVPVKVRLTSDIQYSDRFKKKRAVRDEN